MKALQNTAKIIHCQLCCSRWCRCPQVCYKIRNGKIRLMSHCRDHRCPALKNSTGNALLVKGPEIFNRATSTADDDHVHPCFIQHPDSLYDTLRRSLSLPNVMDFVASGEDVEVIAEKLLQAAR